MSVVSRFQQLPGLLLATILFALLPSIAAQANQKVTYQPKSGPYPSEPAGAVEAIGLISRLPEHGLLGYWTIGAISYQVTEETILDDTEGAFAAGSCALVRYKADGLATAGGTVPPIGGTVPPAVASPSALYRTRAQLPAAKAPSVSSSIVSSVTW